MKRRNVDKNDVETVTLSSSESDASPDVISELEVIPVDRNTPTTNVVDAKLSTVDFVDKNFILVPNSEDTVLLILSDKKTIFFKGKLIVEVLVGSLVNT